MDEPVTTLWIIDGEQEYTYKTLEAESIDVL